MPVNRPIYFAVDGDTRLWSESTWEPVDAFFMGAASVLGAHRVGVYGGKNTVERMRSRGLAHWVWQTFAWSGGLWSPHANLQQHMINVSLCGGAVDLNRAVTSDYGQW